MIKPLAVAATIAVFLGTQLMGALLYIGLMGLVFYPSEAAWLAIISIIVGVILGVASFHDVTKYVEDHENIEKARIQSNPQDDGPLPPNVVSYFRRKQR